MPNFSLNLTNRVKLLCLYPLQKPVNLLFIVSSKKHAKTESAALASRWKTATGRPFPPQTWKMLDISRNFEMFLTKSQLKSTYSLMSTMFAKLLSSNKCVINFFKYTFISVHLLSLDFINRIQYDRS